MTEGRNGGTRVLCLGNDLLADDAVGGLVATQIRHHLGDSVDVVFTANTGFSLIDHLLETRRLIVVDSILTGNAEPGNVSILRERDVQGTAGTSPHYIGLFEALALARTLDLPAAEDVIIVAIEAADLTTIGGSMTPAVETAVSEVVELVGSLVRSETHDQYEKRLVRQSHTGDQQTVAAIQGGRGRYSEEA